MRIVFDIDGTLTDYNKFEGKYRVDCREDLRRKVIIYG